MNPAPGVDYLHPDLAANMWVNPGEIPDNGIDDDENGYVDGEHHKRLLLNHLDSDAENGGTPACFPLLAYR
jgi:hypothetical protein